jgi:hypothetical protein
MHGGGNTVDDRPPDTILESSNHRNEGNRHCRRIWDTFMTALEFLVILVAATGSQTVGDVGISDAAYSLLSARAAANRMRFFVYQDADSALNHGFPSGFFGTVNQDSPRHAVPR